MAPDLANLSQELEEAQRRRQEYEQKEREFDQKILKAREDGYKRLPYPVKLFNVQFL